MLSDGAIIDSDGRVTQTPSVMTKASAVRKMLFSLDLKAESDHLAEHQLLTDYARLVDDMKGVNNYAEAVLNLASGCKSDSNRWRSAFKTDDIIRKLQSTHLAAKPERFSEPSTNLPSSAGLSRWLLLSLRPERLEVKQDLQSSTPGTCLRTQTTGPVEPEQQVSLNYAQKRPPLIHLEETVPHSTSYKLECKKSHVEKNEKTDNSRNPFRTAANLLHENLQNKQTESTSANVWSVGNVRRTLGGRRGPNSQFVLPLSSTKSASPTPHHSVSVGTLSTGQANETAHSPLGDERLKQFDRKIVDLIMSEIMDCKSQVLWDDIAGLEFQKKALQEVVILPMLRPDLFTGLRGPPKGLLLFGPPGTGKTLIGKCVASQSKSTFFSISASSLTSKWVGEGEKMVRALFAVARIHQPAVIFIDEVDSLLTQRSETEHESSRRIKTEFLVQLDGVATCADDRLLFIGATNRPQELDEAARRRFVKRLYIPLPTREARKQIVHRLLRQHKHVLAEPHFQQIAEQSDGYSGADMANLCREAAMGPIRSLTLEAIQNISPDEVRPVELEDFRAAFGQVRASVSTSDLEHYLKWNKQYGSFDAG